MPILNYTTAVPAEKTIGEITSLLVRKGARSINSEYCENGEVEAVSFVMPVGGLPVRFLLPSNTEGVLRVMLKEKPFNATYHGYGNKNAYEAKFKAQANRVSWRILKDWVEAQIALIESGQAEMGQVFMPYALAEQGRTMYELFVESSQKKLGDGR
jgi:hypothetical protein